LQLTHKVGEAMGCSKRHKQMDMIAHSTDGIGRCSEALHCSAQICIKLIANHPCDKGFTMLCAENQVIMETQPRRHLAATFPGYIDSATTGRIGFCLFGSNSKTLFCDPFRSLFPVNQGLKRGTTLPWAVESCASVLSEFFPAPMHRASPKVAIKGVGVQPPASLFTYSCNFRRCTQCTFVSYFLLELAGPVLHRARSSRLNSLTPILFRFIRHGRTIQ